MSRSPGGSTRAEGVLDGRERLLIAAERLYSEHGPGVALRDIARAAGQRNNAAVSYHFGTREGMVEAILDLRGSAMERARRELLESRDEGQLEVDDIVRVLLRPALEVPRQQGSTHFARFFEVIRSYQVVDDLASPTTRWPVTRALLAQVDRRIAHLPPASRRLRIRSLGSSMFAIVADLERDRELGRRPPDVEELVGMLSGIVLGGA